MNPKFDCPSSKTLRTKIFPVIFEKVKCHVTNIVTTEIGEYVSLTTDIWTSDCQDSFISLILHYLTDRFEQMIVLGCFPFNDDHDANNVLTRLEQIISEYDNLSAKIYTVL